MLLAGVLPQGVEVLDVEVAALDLHAPSLSQLADRPGHGLPVSPDHAR